MNDKGGLIFLGILAATAILIPLIFRRRQTEYHVVPVRRLQPVRPLHPVTYTNEEVWDVEYTEDGLVKRVVVHRRAVQE